MAWRASRAQVVFDVVDRLVARGFLDARFFRALEAQRPGRSGEIQLLAGLYASLAQAHPRSAAPAPAPEGPAEPELRWDVFVSYAPTEREEIYPLAVGLHERGIRVFFDEWMVAPGSVISRVIEDGLARTMHGLIAVGPQTAMEDWARAQYDALLNLAVTQDRLLIPVLLGDGPLELPPFLRLRRPVDLRNKDPDDLDTDIETIVRALRGRPPGPPPIRPAEVRTPPPPRPSPPAPRPDPQPAEPTKPLRSGPPWLTPEEHDALTRVVAASLWSSRRDHLEYSGLDIAKLDHQGNPMAVVSQDIRLLSGTRKPTNLRKYLNFVVARAPSEDDQEVARGILDRVPEAL